MRFGDSGSPTGALVFGDEQRGVRVFNLFTVVVGFMQHANATLSPVLHQLPPPCPPFGSKKNGFFCDLPTPPRMELPHFRAKQRTHIFAGNRVPQGSRVVHPSRMTTTGP